MDYCELIMEGFERIEADDPVFYNIYGFDYFFLYKTLEYEGDIYEFEWIVTEPNKITIFKNGKFIEIGEAKATLDLCVKYINNKQDGQKDL
jgi:hypothetical protein